MRNTYIRNIISGKFGTVSLAGNKPSACALNYVLAFLDVASYEKK